MSWQTIKKVLAPPVFEGDEQKSRNAALVNVIVLVTLVASIASFFATLFEGQIFQLGTIEWLAASMSVIFLALFLLLRAGYLRTVSMLVPLLLWFGFTYAIYTFDGIRDGAVVGYFFVIVVAGLSSSAAVLFTFTGLSVLSLVIAYLAELNGWLVTGLTGYSMPVFSDLLLMVLVLVSSALLLRSIVGGTVSAYERARKSAETLSLTNIELATSSQALQAQTDALERRTQYLEMTAEIAHATASLLDRHVLFERVTNLLGQHLALNRVGIFMSDPTHTRAIAERYVSFHDGMATTIGEGLQLEIGGNNPVGQVIATGEPYVTAGTLDAMPFSDAAIPGTGQFDMVLPLRARGRIIGAISVHHGAAAVFTEEDVTVMQTVADLIGIALDNIRLFEQVEENLQAERRARGMLIREAWTKLLRTESSLGYLDDGRQTLPAGDVWPPEMEIAFRSGTAVVDNDGGRCRAVPVRVGDTVIGVLHGCKPVGTWTPEEITLLDTLTEQLNAAIERARLYRDTQRRALREQMTREITDNIRAASSVEEAMKRAVQEIARVLNASEMVARLGTETVLVAGDEGETA